MRFLLPLLLVACTGGAGVVTPLCELGPPTAAPTKARAGESVVLTTVGLTDVFDTAVTFGSTRATVVSVDRTGCDDCDTCVVDTGNAGCNACTTLCNACAELCTTCLETVTVTVPDVPPGDYAVAITNARGVTPYVTVTVTK